MKQNFLRKKEVILAFTLVSITFGLLFSTPLFTGNIISEEGIPINFLSIVGFLLICCAVILGVYYFRKK